MKGSSKQGAQCAYKDPIQSLWRNPTAVRQNPVHTSKRKKGRKKKKKRHLRKALETSMELLKGEGAENKLHCAGA